MLFHFNYCLNLKMLAVANQFKGKVINISDSYINKTVTHFLDLNSMFGIDTISLGDIRCTLKQASDVKEIYTFDNEYKIRVFIPLHKHIEKMKESENFNKFMALDNSIVVLKDAKLDIMISKHDEEFFCNLVLYAKDYEWVDIDFFSDKVDFSLKFIDEDAGFGNFIKNKRYDILSLVGNKECDKSFLLFGNEETYRTPFNNGKIRLSSNDRMSMSNRKSISVIGAVDSYSIKSRSYKKESVIDFYVLDEII
jgi:hypothetical protein